MLEISYAILTFLIGLAFLLLMVSVLAEAEEPYEELTAVGWIGGIMLGITYAGLLVGWYQHFGHLIH